MLRIRSEQAEAFKPVALAEFTQRVVDFLRENHSDAVIKLPAGTTTIAEIPEETLYKMVSKGLERAGRYGITWRSMLKSFVVIMFIAAPNFDMHPLIKLILEDDSVPPDSRIEQLWNRTTDQNWSVVVQNYDMDAWGL